MSPEDIRRAGRRWRTTIALDLKWARQDAKAGRCEIARDSLRTAASRIAQMTHAFGTREIAPARASYARVREIVSDSCKGMRLDGVRRRR